MCRHDRFTFRARGAGLCIALLSAVALGAFRPGEALPDLGTFKLEGSIPRTRGQVVLLDFWASWCGPCKESFPEMEKLHRLYAKRGLVIVAVSVDEHRENMERFVQSMHVSFATVRDANQKLVAAADVQAMPTSFLVDRAGKVRFVHKGFHGAETVKQYRDEVELLLKEPAP
jgi:thiol-disulfide isomerase/thioredoxin